MITIKIKIDGCRKRRRKSPARCRWYSDYRAHRFARRFGCFQPANALGERFDSDHQLHKDDR